MGGSSPPFWVSASRRCRSQVAATLLCTTTSFLARLARRRRRAKFKYRHAGEVCLFVWAMSLGVGARGARARGIRAREICGRLGGRGRCADHDLHAHADSLAGGARVRAYPSSSAKRTRGCLGSERSPLLGEEGAGRRGRLRGGRVVLPRLRGGARGLLKRRPTID